jgi:S1-C subfamily serine protease
MNHRVMAGLGIGCLCFAGALKAASPGVARQFSQEIADVVEQTMPSVAVIRTEAVRYFRGYDPFFGPVRVPRRQAGQGSGIVIDREGHVLTSAHVVAGAQGIQVSFPDESTFAAKLVASNPATDLAVLRLEPEGKPLPEPIAFGDSDTLRIGEFVIAIGSPFSLQSSVTLGIVSQKGRSLGMLPYEDFIQTDAPINPGNSGGPLVDVEGRLVGVNALIHTAGTQGSIGIGFAVPVNLARQVADSLIRNGRFDRPWIGIRPQATPDGVRILEVFDGTPAAHAGLQVGDILRTVNDQKIGNVHDLQRALIEEAPGAALRLEIQRGKESQTLQCRTEPMPGYSAADE